MLNRKLIALILPLLAAGCGFGTEYGVSPIKSPGGEILYFRREVRGRNFDALSLSKNPNYCSKPDPDEAIIFRGMGPFTVFYKFVGDELHLYSIEELKVPRHFSERVKVIIHNVTNPEHIQMHDDYQKMGLEKLDVPIN